MQTPRPCNDMILDAGANAVETADARDHTFTPHMSRAVHILRYGGSLDARSFDTNATLKDSVVLLLN